MNFFSLHAGKGNTIRWVDLDISDTDGHRQGLCKYAVNIADTLCGQGHLFRYGLAVLLYDFPIFPTFGGGVPAREQFIVKLLNDVGASWDSFTAPRAGRIWDSI